MKLTYKRYLSKEQMANSYGGINGLGFLCSEFSLSIRNAKRPAKGPRSVPLDRKSHSYPESLPGYIYPTLESSSQLSFSMAHTFTVISASLVTTTGLNVSPLKSCSSLTPVS